MNKKPLIILVVVCTFFVLSSCSYFENLKLPSLTGSEEEITPNEYSDEQQSVLEDFKKEATDIFNLMKDELSSLEGSTDSGVLEEENHLESLGELLDNNNNFSLSDIDISSLNLENLTDEQISMLMKVITGEMTMTELITSGTFTLKDFQDMGLFDLIAENISQSGSDG